MSMRVSIIAALDEAGGIGLAGSLPWRLPDDLKHFRELTLGHHVIMGRKTWQSIGRPLPQRHMLVVSRNPHFAAPGCTLVHSLEAGAAAAQQAGESELFVIGGGELYALALPLAGRLYLTRVRGQVQADVFFPAVDAREWNLLEVIPHAADARHSYAFCFETYERIVSGVKTVAQAP